MKTIAQSKIAKIFFLMAIISLLSVFCVQIVLSSQSHFAMGMSENSGRNMMPCCQDDSSHMAIYDVPSGRFLLSLLVLSLMAVVSFAAFQASKFFPILAYSSSAPPGTELMLSVKKRE